MAYGTPTSESIGTLTSGGASFVSTEKTTDLATVLDWHVQLDLTAAGTAADGVEVWLKTSVDGTNYAADGVNDILLGRVDTASLSDSRVFSVAAALGGLPPYKFKVRVANKSGSNATGNLLVQTVPIPGA